MRGMGNKDPRPMTAGFSSAGFSLMELMLVLAIMGGLIALAYPRLNKNNSELRASLRRIVVLSRQLRQKAKLSDRTYRIAFRFASDRLASGAGGEEIKSAYWVESGPNAILSSGDTKGIQPLSTGKEFQQDTEIMKEPREFALLELDHILFGSKARADKGIVYIHYLPEGLVEEAVIVLRQGNADPPNYWSLGVHPLTGRIKILSGLKAWQDFSEEEQG